MKFVKQLWRLWVERHEIHKALRLLSKQQWSIEFLTALLIRASRTAGPLEMYITGPDGVSVTVRSAEVTEQRYIDDDIMDHLDDDVYIKQFMERIK
jgi:hypothetical protein